MEPILKGSDEAPHATRMALLVGRYAAPLAIFIVSSGVVLTQPASPVKELSIGLLVLGLVINLATNRFLPKDARAPRTFIRARMALNILINTALMYWLGAFWKPTWLLLALTPLATAIYGGRSETLKSSVLVSAILLGVHSLRPLSSPLEWGEQAAQVAFIVLVSLLVNDLAVMVKRESP